MISNWIGKLAEKEFKQTIKWIELITYLLFIVCIGTVIWAIVYPLSITIPVTMSEEGLEVKQHYMPQLSNTHYTIKTTDRTHTIYIDKTNAKWTDTHTIYPYEIQSGHTLILPKDTRLIVREMTLWQLLFSKQ